MNPLELRGPEFLLCFYIALAVAVATSVLIQRQIRRSVSPETPLEKIKIDLYELAYLAGGRRRAVELAVVNLVQRDALAFVASRLSVSGGLQHSPHPLEQEVFSAVKQGNGASLPHIRSRAMPAIEALRQRLLEQGLTLSVGRRFMLSLAPLVLVGAVLALGIAKIQVGLARQRPVEILVVSVVVVAMVLAVWLMKTSGVFGAPKRSSAGEKLLEVCKHPRGAPAGYAAPTTGDEYEKTALAFAVMGSTVLLGGPLHNLGTAFAPPVSSGGGDGGSCSSGGDGGCGGGGCGGCGGGD